MSLVFNSSQIKELESLATKHGISGNEMMSRAGQAAFDLLRRQWPQAQRIMVICGTGNNGGDGYVLARLAHEYGLQCEVRHIGERKLLKNEALHASQACEKSGVNIQAWHADESWQADLIVDALLGIGVQGLLRAPVEQVIHQINASSLPVLSLDLPSGLDADTGHALPVAVMADVTITFIGYKCGMLTHDGPDYCGSLFCHELDLPSVITQKVQAAAKTIAVADYQHMLAHRRRNSHKGDYGHVLIAGGAPGMSGAVRLAALGASRVGAGLTSIASHPQHADLLNLMQPELMTHAVASENELAPLLRKASVIAVGMGLGNNEWSSMMWQRISQSTLPMVVDAEALNLLAVYQQKKDSWILTPHPGEAGRLLGVSAQTVQQNRYQAIRDLQQLYGGVVILKGCGTLITDGQQTMICTAGNPGMSSGGMGDLLAGIVAGLIAQKLDLFSAACFGVALHAQAGDLTADEKGQRGLLASDLIKHLVKLLNGKYR